MTPYRGPGRSVDRVGDDATYTIGPVLTFDPAAERFTGNDEQTAAANKLLRRDYRAPFVVPENV